MAPRTIVGIDLGQPAEFTALAAVRESGKDGAGRAVWAAPLLKRWPLGTSYADVIRDVARLAGGLGRPALALGVTGVGRPVADLFREAELPVCELVCVTLTAGHAAGRVSWEEQHVPKKDLAGAVQSALQGRRLKVARGLAEAATLVKELSAFRAKVSVGAAAEGLESWRERDHDDLVLALALAVWLGEQGPAPEFEIWCPRLSPGEPPRAPHSAYEQVRYFAPHGSWQPMPELNGAPLLGCPGFRTEAEAAYFVLTLLRLLGRPGPGFSVDLPAGQKADVERQAQDVIRQRRLT